MEKKEDTYTDTFQQCAQWLENNRWIRAAVEWLKQNVKFAIGLVLILMSILYLWFSYDRAATGSQGEIADKMAMEIHELNLAVAKLRQDIEGIEARRAHQEERLWKENGHIRMQLDIIKEAGSFGKIPLSRMQINGREVSLEVTKSFWVSEANLKLSRLGFGESQGDPITAREDIVCSYSVNRGPQQDVTGVGDTVTIPLSVTGDEKKFAFLFSKITFKTSPKDEYTGFGSFTVYLDQEKPEIIAEMEENNLRVTIYDEGGDAVGDSIALKVSSECLDPKFDKTWEVTPANPYPFEWTRLQRKHQVRLPARELANWEKLNLQVADIAGNIAKISMRNLPLPKFDTATGSHLSLPVVLNVVSVAPTYLTRLSVEKFENGMFQYLRETGLGAMSLPEGRYRAKAFFVVDGERGPYSLPVEFFVDTTPPHAEISLRQEENRLYWQINPSEKKVKLWTSVEWEGKFQALNAVGNAGYCELPEQAERVTVQVRLQDEAGNENVLTKVWDCAKNK